MGTAMQHLRTLQMDKYNRQNAMTDEFRSSEIGRLNDSISSIQNNPMLSEDEKSGKIQAARSQILGMYTPALGKKRVAQLQQQYGLTPAAPQQGTVPAQPPTQFTAPPLQGESLGIPVDNGQGGTEGVPLGAPGGTFPTIDLPGKQAQPISNTPATVSDTLAAGHKQQYIPVTLANGTTMMLPQNLAGHLIATQESNAGKRGIAELKANSTEDIAGQNRDSRESIANQNRDSRESMAANKAAKPANRDDQAIAIMQRQFEAKNPSLTPDQSYKMAYDKWVQETKVNPRVQGYSALTNMRVMPAVDPNNPENVIPMHAGDAVKQGVSLPASIPFQTTKALQKTAIAGKMGETLTAFNIAIKHTDQLLSAATALDNGDLQLANRIGNAWATATGSPAPTEFNGIRNAVAGEIAKAFKGAGASDQEIKQIVDTINQSQSPQQLIGVANQYRTALGSKRDVLKQQYEQGLQGQPNFGEANAAPPTAPATPGGLKAKANAIQSGYVRIQDSKGGLHDIPKQNLPAAQKRDPGLKVINQ
jgi:hypothetical protein